MAGAIGFNLPTLMSGRQRLEKALEDNKGKYKIKMDGSIVVDFNNEAVKSKVRELIVQLENIKPEDS
ncbi:UNVERIFIED_ORG: hypothetical protein M2355_001794 [Lelliottia amnigena]|nr:hypothetical protein [Lelliottia amnigena]